MHTPRVYVGGTTVFRVVAVNEDSLELWDGKSLIDYSHPGIGKSTLTVAVSSPTSFQVGDRVSLQVVLEHRDDAPPA